MNSFSVSKESRRFLLIDDDTEFCTYFSRYAHSIGMTLDFYTSLLDLEAFTTNSAYDVVIIDFDLGAHVGPDLVNYLSALFGNIPIYLVSAYSKERIQPYLVNHPTIEYISKSLGFANIIATIQMRLMSPESHQKLIKGVSHNRDSKVSRKRDNFA